MAPEAMAHFMADRICFRCHGQSARDANQSRKLKTMPGTMAVARAPPNEGGAPLLLSEIRVHGEHRISVAIPANPIAQTTAARRMTGLGGFSGGIIRILGRTAFQRKVGRRGSGERFPTA